MVEYQQRLSVQTRGRGLTDITQDVAEVVGRSGVSLGTCTVLVRHTSASLVIQENADPSVRVDLQSWMNELAPESRHWQHADEGPDDMPAHARAAITRTSEVVPVCDGALTLGTWQGLYLWEHRAIAHQRQVVVHVSGQAGG